MARIDVYNNLEDFRIKLNVSEGNPAISIESYSGEDETVTIPASFAGIPVTAIGTCAFSRRKKVKHVILPEGLTSIGNYAFSGCTELKSLFIPESLTCIDAYAFSDCKQLTKINIPKGLIKISYDMFVHCTNLTEFTIDKNNPVFTAVDGVLFDKAMTTLVLYPAGKKGGYTVPDTVFDFDINAFSGCRELTSISIPQSFMSDGHAPFSGCEKLADITVSEHNSMYGSSDGVLFNKDGTVLFEYPMGRENDNYAVPERVIRIYRCAFENCKFLSEVILPEGLTVIENHAFSGCERLTAITLPMSLQYIGRKAFDECPNLETITLSRNTKMGYKALKGFSGKLIYRD